MTSYQINHILSTALLRSAIFDALIARVAAATPPDWAVRCTVRPQRGSTVFHYHRPNLEWRLRPNAVVTVHHDLRDEYGWLGLRSFLPRYREAAAVHCLNSQQQAHLAAEGITHTHVIPHGVDRAVFPVPTAPNAPVHPGRLSLGIASRRYGRGVKGEALLIGLLDHLDPARVDFVLIGEDRWRDAVLLRQRGFAVEAFERPPYRLFGALYARMDLLLILSDFEGGPASLPEALGSATPVAATPVGMIPDLVRDGANGIVLERDPARDGARLMALLDDGGAGLDRLLNGAFATAEAVPSWDAVMARYFALYADVAGTGAGAAR